MPQKKSNPIFTTPSDGDTLLHLAVRKCKTSDEIATFVKALDPDDITHMSLTINNLGSLPIELANKLPTDVANQIYQTITPYMMRDSSNDMSTPINFEEVIRNYPAKPDSTLYHYLELACKTVNNIRKIYHHSTSHPQINGLSKSEFDKLQTSVQAVRDSVYEKKQAIKEKGYLGSKLFTALLAAETNLPEQSGLGNCREQAYSALKLIYNNDPQLTAGVYHVFNGDHMFVVIDPEGEKVLCDPWAGKVCPGYAIGSELGNLVISENLDLTIKVNGMPVHYNFITNFNPHYHKLKPAPLFDSYTQQLRCNVDTFGKIPSLETFKPLKQIMLDDTGLKPQKTLEEAIVDSLNACNTSVLPFLFMTSYGRSLLVDKKVRDAITSDLLNTSMNSNIHSSPAQFLSGTTKGQSLLKKYPDLCYKINPVKQEQYGHHTFFSPTVKKQAAIATTPKQTCFFPTHCGQALR